MRDPAWQQGRTPAALEGAIRHGQEGGMPPFERVLQPEQVQRLVAFIRALPYRASQRLRGLAPPCA
jgi:mono/diheme cytochrome c family protein